MVHEQLRPFECDLCGNKFSTKQSLKMHVESVHEKKRNYACDECSQRFGCKRVLLRHVKKTHNDVSE